MVVAEASAAVSPRMIEAAAPTISARVLKSCLCAIMSPNGNASMRPQSPADLGSDVFVCASCRTVQCSVAKKSLRDSHCRIDQADCRVDQDKSAMFTYVHCPG